MSPATIMPDRSTGAKIPGENLGRRHGDGMSWFKIFRAAITGASRGVRRDEAVRLRADVVRLCRENRFTEAAKVAQALIDWQRAEIGETHPDFARGLINLALILRKQGDLPAATRVAEQAASLRRLTLGPDHPDTAKIISLVDEWRVQVPPTSSPDPAPQTPPPEPAGEPPDSREFADQHPGLDLTIAELSNEQGGGVPGKLAGD